MKIDTLRKLHGDLCHYCKVELIFGIRGTSNANPRRATVEHLIPAYESPTNRKIGGLDNCVLACVKCNNERDIKWTHDPANREKLIIHNYRKMNEKYQKMLRGFGTKSKIASLQKNLEHFKLKYEFLSKIS